LKAETETCMRLLGVETVSELGPKHVSRQMLFCSCGHSADSCEKINSRAVERDIYNGHAGLEKLGLWAKANL
jgi:hypothetical protein